MQMKPSDKSSVEYVEADRINECCGIRPLLGRFLKHSKLLTSPFFTDDPRDDLNSSFLIVLF